MTAVPRCLATADDRPDNPDRFCSARPRPATRVRAGMSAAPSPPAPRVGALPDRMYSPKGEHRCQPKGNTGSGMWNIHSGGEGAPAPVRYVTVYRSVLWP